MTASLEAKKSVLVVDDDDTLRDAIVFDFKRKGYQVFSAANGLEAFDIVKTEKIDVVITDIRMPKGDGVELLDNIKKFNVRIPVVIFITGFADLAPEDAYDKGACAIMSKPFDRKQLIQTVQTSLQSYSEKLTKPLDPTLCNIKVELKFHDGAEALNSKIISIGQGGMFFAITDDQRPKLNQSISFKIEHPNESLIHLEGQGIVRWIRANPSSELKKGFGIEFVFFNENCRNDVIKFLENLQVKAFIPKAA